MSPLMVAGVIFACVLGSALLAMLLGRALPEQHLRPESKEAVKFALAFVATLAALVLGLLVAAAKGTYDPQRTAVTQLAADVLLLDRALALYGRETKEAQEKTKEAQELLRRGATVTLNRLWPEDGSQPADLTPGEAREVMESFYGK